LFFVLPVKAVVASSAVSGCFRIRQFLVVVTVEDVVAVLAGDVVAVILARVSDDSSLGDMLGVDDEQDDSEMIASVKSVSFDSVFIWLLRLPSHWAS
jgi:hypothetical protein